MDGMQSLSLDIPALHLNPRLEVEAVERKRGRYNRYSQNHILQHIQTLNHAAENIYESLGDD